MPPLYIKLVEVGNNNKWSSQATDQSQTQPAPEPPVPKLSAPEQQTRHPKPQEPKEIQPKPSSPDKSSEDKKLDLKELSPVDDVANYKDKAKRQMSLCSNEVCTIDEKKALLNVAAAAMGTVTEIDSDRPASPVPFQAEVSPSVSSSNVVESMEVTAQDVTNSTQKVETFEEDNIQTVKRTKVEESYSSSSKIYSAEMSTQSQLIRTSTPELEQIMGKKHAFPSLQQPTRPLTPSTLAVQRRIASQPTRCLTPEIEQAMDKPHGCFSPVPPAAAVHPLSPSQVVVFPPEFSPLPPVSRSKHDSVQSEKRHMVHSSYTQESAQQNIVADLQGGESKSVPNYESTKSQKEKSEELVTKTHVEEIIKHELNKILSHEKSSSITPGKLTDGMTVAPDRPFTPVPLPRPITIPAPVSLPPETVPFYPSSSQTPQHENTVHNKTPACPSPMLQALTVAPEHPYSPLPSATAVSSPFTSTPASSASSFKPITGDLPVPPKGGKPISMLSALTTAPETPYSLPGISPNNETLKTTPKKLEPIQKYAPKPTNGVFKPIATPSTVKPHVAEVKPLPLPVPKLSSQEDMSNVQIKTFPPVSDELKSVFSQQSSFGPVKKSSATISEKSNTFIASSETSHQKSESEIRESHSFQGLSVPLGNIKRPSSPSISRLSPSGLHAPTLLPYYQQNIGEIPLAHRPKSPIPHAIRAPMINPPKETIPKQPHNQVLSMASSYSQKIAASQNQSSRVHSQPLNPSTVSFLQDQQPKKTVPVLGYQPSPLVGKAPLPGEQNVPKSGIVPSHLDRTKQVFKPVIPSQGSENIQNTQPELNKTLNKSVPYFVKDNSVKENDEPTAPWRVVKVNDSKTSTQPPNNAAAQSKTNLTLDPQAANLQVQQPQSKPSLNTDVKPTPKFEAPDPKKRSLVPELTVPSKPSSSSIPNAGPGGPGGKTGTIAGTTAPRRGRGIMNPNVGIGARIPLCGQCHNQIRGPFITALGKIWCPEHFVCVNNQCRRPLQDIGFVEEAAGLYCEYCFEQYLAPVCNKCNTKIKGDCLNAIGKHFHPECFTCAYCGKLFGNSPFFLEDALPYCENDWNELFTTKCFSCGFPIEAGDRWVEALNNNYHSQCFNCTMCKKNLEGQSFYAKGGRPFCKNHAR